MQHAYKYNWQMQYRLFEHQFHSSASEIESKAVSVIRAVFFGLYACLFLLALKDLAKYKAGSDSFTVQSTDITLARALNGSSVDSKVTYFCINFEWNFYVN